MEIDHRRNERVLGTSLAGAGALAGRFGFLGAVGAAGAAAGGLLGPVGAVVGGLAGIGAGAFLELRDKYFQGVSVAGHRLPLGRMLGGALGGAVGTLVGKALDKLPGGIKLGSERLEEETRGYSFGKLLKNLNNVEHTSNPTMNERGSTGEILGLLKPGDVLMTNNDVWMDFEIPLKLTGHRGDWTHTALYVGDGNVVESLGSRGVIKRTAEVLVGENHHVKILRPEYSQESLRRTIDVAEAHIGDPYDNKFSLKTDDALYCIEHTQKALKAGNPAISLEPSSILGWKVVSPQTFNTSKDFEVVYDTGSSFARNYLSKFS